VLPALDAWLPGIQRIPSIASCAISLLVNGKARGGPIQHIFHVSLTRPGCRASWLTRLLRP
jgi:hypothetical protein